jgi:hypothetical protein
LGRASRKRSLQAQRKAAPVHRLSFTVPFVVSLRLRTLNQGL